MTENPAGEGANPFGAVDLGAMLEQAQQMQNQLLQAQAELASQEVDGSAGGVTVTLTGGGELTAVAIKAGAFDGTDAESLADLGDLVVAAFRDARGQVEALTAETLGPLSGMLGGDLGAALGDGSPGPGLGG